MNKKRRFWVRSILLLIMIGLIAFPLYQLIKDDQPQKPAIGDMAPDFQLTSLDGEQMSLKRLKGKAVVLNFWGSWCEPCRTEMPALTEIYQQYQSSGLEVIGINIAETDVTASQFVRQYQLNFPIWMDRNRDVVDLYGIGPIPSTYFIDPSGKIVYIREGPLQVNELKNLILPILPKPKGAMTNG